MIQKIRDIVNDLFTRHRPGRGIQPKTIEEAMRFLHSTQLAREMTGFVTLNEMNLHHTVGQQLRNSWGLWHGSELARDFVTRLGLTHADDMSGILLSRLWAEVHERDFNAELEARKYQAHWQKTTGRSVPGAEWAHAMLAPVWNDRGFRSYSVAVSKS